MPRIAFTFSYQAFSRYVRDNCDSEQEVDKSLVKESWLYGNMREYLDAHVSRIYDVQFEAFAPAEFQTGRPGAPRKIDLVGYSRRSARERVVALLIEAKLMVDDNRDWCQEILTDILRVACLREHTNRRTQRYVMVVG